MGSLILMQIFIVYVIIFCFVFVFVFVFVFFFPDFMKCVYLGGNSKDGNTTKVENSEKVTKRRKRENEITDAHK